MSLGIKDGELSFEKPTELYNHIAAKYSSMMQEKLDDKLYSVYVPQLSKVAAEVKGDILDIGCGSGECLMVIERENIPNRRLIGVDPTEGCFH